MGNIKDRCVIIGGGDCTPELIKSNISENDYIICADSGYDMAVNANIFEIFSQIDVIFFAFNNANNIILL